MSLRLVTPPAGLVVSLGEAKAHLREDSADQDAAIQGYLAGAIGWLDGANGWLGRALGVQTWDLTLDAFHGNRIVIPLPPLRSVDSVSYLDGSGATVTIDPGQYRAVDKGEQCSHIVPAPGACWPATLCGEDAVTVRFTAGYDAIPATIRNAILLLVGHFNENREAVNVGNIVTPMPMGVDALLHPFRVWAA